MISCLVSTPLHTEVRNPSTGENGGENLVQPPILPTEQSLISQHLSLSFPHFHSFFLFSFFFLFSHWPWYIIIAVRSTVYLVKSKQIESKWVTNIVQFHQTPLLKLLTTRLTISYLVFKTSTASGPKRLVYGVWSINSRYVLHTVRSIKSTIYSVVT